MMFTGKPKVSEVIEEVKRGPTAPVQINTPSPKSQGSTTYDSRTPGAASKGPGAFATRPQSTQLALAATRSGPQVQLLTN